MQALGLKKPSVAPGEAVCVRVDWTMANELTLVGINDSACPLPRALPRPSPRRTLLPRPFA